MTKSVVSVGTLITLLAGCGRDAAHNPQAAAPVPAVAVATIAASNEDWPSVYEATGTVRARSSTTISSKWLGYVREVKVRIGDRVHAGQLLVTLDARDLEAAANRAAAVRDEVRQAIQEADSAISVAQAHLDLAAATFHRMNELYQKKSISDQEFDEANEKLKAAAAEFAMVRAKRAELDSKLAQAGEDVRAAQVTRSYAVIESPAVGLVTAKSVEPGNLAAPGAPLLTIEGGGYRFEASVEESKLASIRVGQSVSVSIDGMNHTLGTRVSEIVPSVDSASRAYTVKIDLLPAPAIRSGIFGRADFALSSHRMLAIPAAAVAQRGELEAVFVADGNMARLRLITLGDRWKDRVQVLSGLSAGDKVIVPVPDNLSDSATIEVRP